MSWRFRASSTSVTLAVVLTTSPPLVAARAQADTSHSVGTAPQADSAREARAAYRRAGTAYRQHDLVTARTEMARVIRESSPYDRIRSGSWVRKRGLTYEVMKKLPRSR